MIKKKTLFLVAALVLIVGCVIGGSLAWLTASTEGLKNTFTTSDIDITLTETKGGNEREFKMIPGWKIAKDPKVTVKAGSEDCWLFVKIEKSTNFDNFMTYSVETGEGKWTQGDGESIPNNVYYRKVTNIETDSVFYILSGEGADDFQNGRVNVKDTVTKADMSALTGHTYPSLTFTAYASQLMKDNINEFEAADAWANAQPTT